MADTLTNTTKAAETAITENVKECAHDNELKCSDNKNSNKHNGGDEEEEAAIPLSRYKAKLEECAQLHQQLQSAHEELTRLKHQISGQEISSTHAHNEIENLRVLQRMMHEELHIHQIRLRSLLKENDELAAQVHALQEVCEYQFKCAERSHTNREMIQGNQNNNIIIPGKEMLNSMKSHYRYSMKEMSDKLYFLTHAHQKENNCISKADVCNPRETNINYSYTDNNCKSKINENVEEEKQALLSAYVKASCELNVEPHPQLLTSLYCICTRHSTGSRQSKEKNNTISIDKNNEWNLTMVEPPITFAQLAVLEQFLTRPFYKHDHLVSVLTKCVHRITLRVQEESNEAGITFFVTHLLPLFTSLQHLEIYHLSTTLALRALVESLTVLQVLQKNNWNYNHFNESHNTNIKDTNTNHVCILYLSLPFLSVNDDALQMLFKLLQQRELLCKDNQSKELQGNCLKVQNSTCNHLDGDHLHSMQLPLLAMSSLDLSLCNVHDPCTLRSCNTCPYLTCLMLTNCTQLTNSLLHRLLRHLPELSHLDLSGCTALNQDGIQFINSFANVKVLRLENVPRITHLSLKYVEVLFSTLTCVRQLNMPLLKCLPLPIRNRALISTPQYFIAPHLQQVALHDMWIDECTLNCFLNVHNTSHYDDNSVASESDVTEVEKEEMKEKQYQQTNSVRGKQGEMCILEFVHCTFTNDNALMKLLELYKAQNTLHTLKLQGCVGLSVSIFHSLPSSLRELNISFTKIACDKSLSVLVERCPYLENLNLCSSAYNASEKVENEKEQDEIGNAICDRKFTQINALSDVGLRCLLSLSYLRSLNVLQLPSLTNDGIVLLIYSLPSLKLLYHETVAVSHLLNAKGELECSLQSRTSYCRQLNEHMKKNKKSSSSFENVVEENNNYYGNNIVHLINGKSRFCELQIRRHCNNEDDNVHNSNLYINHRLYPLASPLEMLFEKEVNENRDDKEQINKDEHICTLRDLLRCKRPAELMTWNEHQHPAFLINPEILINTSAENVTRTFTLSSMNKENTMTANNYVNKNTCEDDDDDTKRKEKAINNKENSHSKKCIKELLAEELFTEENQQRPISAISLTSDSTVSSTSSSQEQEDRKQQEEEQQKEEHENQVESKEHNKNSVLMSPSKSAKRVSFIVPEETNHLQINSALRQNDRAMTHARNKARRNKLHQTQNSNTVVNSTRLTSAESNGETNSNGKSTVPTNSDNARVEIGPW